MHSHPRHHHHQLSQLTNNGDGCVPPPNADEVPQATPVVAIPSRLFFFLQVERFSNADHRFYLFLMLLVSHSELLGFATTSTTADKMFPTFSNRSGCICSRGKTDNSLLSLLMFQSNHIKSSEARR